MHVKLLSQPFLLFGALIILSAGTAAAAEKGRVRVVKTRHAKQAALDRPLSASIG